MKPVYMPVITFVAVSCFLFSCNKQNTSLAVNSKTRVLLDSTKNMSGTHNWRGTYITNMITGQDTTYSITDTSLITVINDTTIVAFNDTLSYFRIDSVGKNIVFSYAKELTLGLYQSQVLYYYAGDSISYYNSSIQGHRGYTKYLKTP